MSYYRRDLALIHHLGYGFHADACAPGILRLLEPVRRRDGLVVELGCGSGQLTRHLVAAGHRVVATDASPDMLELARTEVPGAESVERLVLPADPIPEADAVVSVGHVLSYLPDVQAVHQALRAAAGALRPGGVIAIDLCDLEYGRLRSRPVSSGRVEEDWAIVVETSSPSEDRFVREMTTFVLEGEGRWRRDDERHVNVLLDTASLPGLLAEEGVEASIGRSFGEEDLMEGLRTVIGTKRPS